MVRPFVKAATLVALIAGCIYGPLIHQRSTRNTSDRPYGRFTRDQIEKRSMPVCGAISPDTGPLALVSSSHSTWEKGRDQDRLWLVDAYDCHDVFRVHLVWNADTGVLARASRADSCAPRVSYKKTLHRIEAERV